MGRLASMKIVCMRKLLEDMQKIADLAIYNCDYLRPGRLDVSSEIVDYFQSDEFGAVGELLRGEAEMV